MSATTQDAAVAAAAESQPGPPKSRGSVDDLGVFDDAKTYYTADERHSNNRAGPRTRTYSQVREVSPASHPTADPSPSAEQPGEAIRASGSPRALSERKSRYAELF
jgi:hypothetical protein